MSEDDLHREAADLEATHLAAAAYELDAAADLTRSALEHLAAARDLLPRDRKGRVLDGRGSRLWGVQLAATSSLRHLTSAARTIRRGLDD